MKRKPRHSRLDPEVLREDPYPFGRDDPGGDSGDESFEELRRYLEAIEVGPTTTLSHLLIRDGIELPPPDSFTAETVHGKLWEVIRGMAKLRHFLVSTDHLSDLGLYRKLWEETLNEPTDELTPDMGDCACHIDLLGDGSEESNQLWLRYFACELDREFWAQDFPDVGIPEPAAPPHDRDRHLPKR